MIYINKLLGIGNKLLIIGLVLALGPTIVLGSILYTSSKKTTEEALVAHLVTHASAKAGEVRSYVDTLSKTGHFLSATKRVVDGFGSLSRTGYNLNSWDWLNQRQPEIDALGRQIMDHFDFDIFLLITPSGKVAYSTDPSVLPGRDLSSRDYVQGASAGLSTFSSVFFSEIINANCIAIGIPVFQDEDSGRVLGIASFVVTQEHLTSKLWLGTDTLGNTASIYLMEPDGTVVTGKPGDESDPVDQEASSWAISAVSKAMLQDSGKTSETGRYKSTRGKPVLGYASVVHIGNHPYGLIIEVDEDEVFSALAGLRNYTLLVVGVVALAAVLIAVRFGRTLILPINSAVAMVKSIAEGEGDLTQRLEIKSKDEIEQLATWFNKFLDYISGIIRNITLTSNNLAATSQELSATSEESTSIAEQIAETAQQLAGGAAEQSETASNTAVAAEKLSAAVEKVAQGTQAQHGAVDTIAVVISDTNRVFTEVLQVLENVRAVAENNTTAAERAAESIQVLAGSMSNIQIANDSAAVQVSELHNLSQSIRQIVSVIDDIASQTNLLALNAAIEAARAGEHGRGFAVVADEVRKLAERSLAETKNIGELISRVASSIDHTVASIDQSTQEIQKGSSVAENANNVLSEIGMAATGTQQEVSQLMASFEKLKEASAQTESAANDIAVYAGENLSGVEEMAISAEEVKRLVENVAAVSQESAAAIEQVAASIREMAAATDQVSSSAQDLAGQAETLQSIVGNFKVQAAPVQAES